MADDKTSGGEPELPEPRLPDAARLPDPPPVGVPAPPPPPIAPPPPTPTVKASRRTRPLVGILVGIGVVGVVAFFIWVLLGDTDGDTTERDDDGEVTEAGEVDVNKLRVGDCVVFDDDILDKLTAATAEQSKLASVRAVPCAEQHHGEVIHRDARYFAGESELPDEATAFRVATPACLAQLEVYTAQPVDTGQLDVNTITPVEEGWPVDRSLVCIGVTWDESFEELVQTTGSLEASAASETLELPTFKLFSDSSAGECYDLRNVLERSPEGVFPLFGRLVPCSEEHTLEVISNDPTFYEDDDAAPSPSDTTPDDLCLPALVEYTGQPYETSPYDYVALFPSPESWDFFDRALTCLGATFDEAGNLLHPTGSIAAS